MILSDKEVMNRVNDGKIDIDPRPNKNAWQGMTFDGHLSSRIFKIKSRAPGGGRLAIDLIDYTTDKFADNFWEEVEPTVEGYFPLHPFEFRLAYTEEKISLPNNSNTCAFVEGKSGLARIGLGIHFAPIIHCGFGANGLQPIMLEIYNHSRTAIYLRPRQKICQFMFAEVSGGMETEGNKNLGNGQPEA